MLLGRPSSAGSPVRLRARLVTDSYGDRADGWASPARSPLRGAQVDSGASVEVDGVTRSLTTDERLLLIPGRVDLTKDDRVEIDGEVWRVDGRPIVRVARASRVFTRALLRRVSTG